MKDLMKEVFYLIKQVFSDLAVPVLISLGSVGLAIYISYLITPYTRFGEGIPKASSVKWTEWSEPMMCKDTGVYWGRLLQFRTNSEGLVQVHQCEGK